MKFSIIVPVYNGEMYLDKCLFSILEQTIAIKQYGIIGKVSMLFTSFKIFKVKC